MKLSLGPIDLGIVILYCLGMVGLGWYFSRRQNSSRTYLLGNKNVPWWLILISIVATETSTVTFLSVTGKGYANPGNLTFLQLALGIIIGRCLIAWWLLPQYFRGELFSAYQILRERFGSTVQRTASALFLLTRAMADGLRLFLAGLFLSATLDVPVHQAILIMSLITLVYTYLGGIEAIFWTDLIQFVIKLLGAIVALVVTLQLLPDGWETYYALASESNRFQLFVPLWNLTQDNVLVTGIIGGAFLTMATHGADQLMVQRYLCARSLTQARLALMSSGGVIFLQFLLFLLVGIGFHCLQASGRFDFPVDTPPDKVFSIFLSSDAMPMGIKGIIIAAVLAAAMSTLSASWNSSASVVVFDFYKAWRNDLPDKHYLGVARLVTCIAGFIQTTVALLAESMLRKSVVDEVLGIAGFSAGLLLGVFILGTVSRRISGRSVLGGMMAGLLCTCLAKWYFVIAWPWFAPVGAITTVLSCFFAEWMLSAKRNPPLPPGS